MSPDVIVVGGGEHARVVMDAVLSCPQLNLIGFLDPQPCETTVSAMGVPRLGSDEHWVRYPHAQFVAGVGAGINSIRNRRSLIEKFGSAISWVSVVHPDAHVSPFASVEPGVFIGAGAIVQTGAHIGRHAILNTGVVVEHDCSVGVYSHLAPGVLLGGGVTVGEECFVGLGSIIRDHITIGSGSCIAMASQLTRSCPPETILGRFAQKKKEPS